MTYVCHHDVTFWHHDVLFLCHNLLFDFMIYVMTSWRTFNTFWYHQVMIYFWCHDTLFDVMTYFWLDDILFFTNFWYLNTHCILLALCIFLRHDPGMTYFLKLWTYILILWYTFWRPGVFSIIYDVMTYALTSWRTFNTFWRHGVHDEHDLLFDFMMYILTSFGVFSILFDVFTYFCLHHDVIFYIMT